MRPVNSDKITSLSENFIKLFRLSYFKNNSHSALVKKVNKD